MVKRVALVIVGAYLCLVGALVHRQTAYAHGVSWPWGLALVLGGTVAVVRAAMSLHRMGAAWLGLGWAVALLALTVPQFSPGGSYLVASDWLGWVFTAGCLGVIVVAAVRTPRVDQ
ncbi:MAG: hypothetical protein JWR83_1287 [Aeromicrobium sp.]|nr:hypothetical protein [Aeromicrobium sp.]